MDITQISIDLYLWHPEVMEWLYVPKAHESIEFIQLTPAEILTSQATVVIRANTSFVLGIERDEYDLDALCYALHESIVAGSTTLPSGGYIKTELVTDAKERVVVISRKNMRQHQQPDYYEQTAHVTGAYYQDIPLPLDMWRQAVLDTLHGLRAVLDASQGEVLHGEKSTFLNWLKTGI